MTIVLRFLLMIALLVGGTSPAYAGPLAAVVPIIIGAVVKSVVLKVLLTVALSVAVSALTKTSAKKQTAPGIQTERRLTGGVNSRTIMLGLYATAGSEAAPPMSYGNDGKTPNAYLCVPVVLSDYPIDGFSRLIVNGEYVDVNTAVTAQHGWPIGGKYSGKAWLRIHDGRQVAADATLSSIFAGYVRPWGNDKIGFGVAYAVVTFLYDSTIYTSEPEVLFEVRGARLYDPRKDDTVGGVGGHRWGDASTYEYTDNPIVQTYNVLRGIPFPDGSVFGGECIASDLPLSNWVAGMNVCDEIVTTSQGDEKRYRAGFEIKVAEMDPATVVEELLKSCAGEITEDGGTYKVRVGGPGLPVMFITDADFIVSQPRDYDPHPGMNDAKNTVYGSYPSPAENWGTHDAPVQQDAAFVARDQGIELSTSVQFPAVPYPLQVQRLMLALLKDDQRWRRHSLTIGHFGFALEPLDVIAWTSERNQYVDKLFDIASCDIDPFTLSNTLSMREVDPTDYHYQVTDELPDPVTPGAWDLPEPQAVPGFGVNPAAIKDGDGTSRRPALRVFWSPDAADDATFVKVQVRLAAAPNEPVADLTAPIGDAQTIVSEGILPGTAYQVRGKIIANRATIWTDWLSVTSPDIKLSLQNDFDGLAGLEGDIATALAAAQAAQEAAATAVADIEAVKQDIIDAGGEIDTLEQTVATQGGYITTNATAISNLAGDLSELSTTVSAQNSLITQNATALSSVEGSLASLSSTVSSQGSTIEQTAQTVSTLALETASLTAIVTSSSPNLIPNGAFRSGLVGWGSSYPNVARLVKSAQWGNFIQLDGNFTDAFEVCSTPLFAIEPGVAFTKSCDLAIVASDSRAIIYADLQYFDVNGNFHSEVVDGHYASDGLETIAHAPRTFTNDPAARQALSHTEVTPGFAAKAYLRVVCIPNGATVTSVAARLIKLERSDQMSPFTDEATAAQSFQSITTISTQLSQINQSLSTQGVTISNTTSAITSFNGSIATALARVALRLDVNGYVTGWETNNNGSYGNFVINADNFAIVKPGGGPRTEYSAGNWRAYDATGFMFLRWGTWA